MQKYLLNASLSGIVFLLAGCQSTTTTAPNPAVPGRPAPSLFSPFASNTNIAQTVQGELMRNADPVIAQVQVQQYQNVVVLTGYVRKIKQSDIAERIAGQIAGPQNVRNNIIIRP